MIKKITIVALLLSITSILTTFFFIYHKFVYLSPTNLELVVNGSLKQNFLVFTNQSKNIGNYFLIPPKKNSHLLKIIYHIDTINDEVFMIPIFNNDLFYIGGVPLVDRNKVKPYVLCQLEAKFEKKDSNQIIIDIGGPIIKEEPKAYDISDESEAYFFNSKVELRRELWGRSVE